MSEPKFTDIQRQYFERMSADVACVQAARARLDWLEAQHAELRHLFTDVAADKPALATAFAEGRRAGVEDCCQEVERVAMTYRASFCTIQPHTILCEMATRLRGGPPHWAAPPQPAVVEPTALTVLAGNLERLREMESRLTEAGYIFLRTPSGKLSLQLLGTHQRLDVTLADRNSTP